MWIQTEHELTFEYSEFISESRVELRVEPRTTQDQTLRSFSLAIGPPTSVNRYTDWNGNLVHHFGIDDYHDRIEILATSLVVTHRESVDTTAIHEIVADRNLGPLLEWLRFTGPVVRSPALEALAKELPCDSSTPVGQIVAQSGQMIRDRFRYETGVSHSGSTTANLLEGGAGVCQDFAHLQLALLRLHRIPARYVSGYLHLGAEVAAQSHAWIEVHSQEYGWVGYDPTHTCSPDERYVVIGWGRDYDDVPPNRGVFRGSAEESLRAAVRTQESEPEEFVHLHEALSEIDVPVYREIPSLIPDSVEAEATLPDQQQQQAQQQQ